MKKILILLIAFSSLSLFATLSTRGYVELDKRFMEDNIAMPGMYNTAHIEFKNDVSDNVSVFLSTEMRFYDNSNITKITDLTDASSEYPYDFFVWEAYGDIYDFLGVEGLDLRIGKQLISWGSADGLTPTNVLNPNDFSDLLSFTDTIPVFAVKLDYSFLDNYSLTYIWEPKAQKVLLPSYMNLSFLSPSVPISGMTVTGVNSTTIEEQDYIFKNSVNAVKLRGTNFNIDWSLSYYHGYEDIFLPKSVTVTPTGATKVTEDIALASPRVHMIGFDMAGELASIGYWGEVGVFIPDGDFVMNLNLPTGTVSKSVLDSPYVKYTLGLDYTFSTGTYVNAQFAHGFFTELGKDNLEDYIFARVEQKFLNDKVKVKLGGILNTDGFKDIQDNYGLGILPELSYLPYDDVELSIGGFFIYGSGSVLFADMRDYDQVYLRAKYNF